MDNYPPTYFIDIDGTINSHKSDLPITDSDGIKPFFNKLERLNAKIIITTGRKESERATVIFILNELGIHFDELIMGCNRGERVIINDVKPPNDMPTACAINVDRDNFIWGLLVEPHKVVEKTTWGWRQLLDYKHQVYKIYINENESWCPPNTNEFENRKWQILDGEIDIYIKNKGDEANIHNPHTGILVFDDLNIEQIVNLFSGPTIILETIL